MKQNKRGLISLFLSVFIALSSVCGDVQAKKVRELVIGGGQLGGLPIAIVPFALTGAWMEQDKDALEDVAAVIRADLKSSGQFQPMAVSDIKQTPESYAGVQYAYWHAAGMEHLVVGSLKKTGSARFTVQFELLDVLKGIANATASRPLLSMHFENIRPHELRALAHHISDHLFEQLLGIKGIFSTRIAYITTSEGQKGLSYALEIADADGHHPKTVKHSRFPLMSPAWSPEGQRIAFVSFEKNRPGIHIVELTTGRSEKISQFPGINGAPTWSPDGRTLALVLSKDGSPKIYTLDLATRHLQRVTEGAGIDTEPAWDPTGKSIVFTSNRGGKPQIYRVTMETGKIERLTFIGEYNAKPSLTPDGKRLVMIHQSDDGRFNIAVQNLVTGEVLSLTQTSLDDSPCLAPNGMMVLYGTQEAGRGVLGAVSLEGRVRFRLPIQAGNMHSPAWSPFVGS